MMTLQAVSYLAPNWFGFYQTLTYFLEQALQINICLTQGACDPLVDPLLLGDRIDLTFICGLPLMRSQRIAPGMLRPIVAPVLQSARYQNRPVYFSDVIVHAQSPYQTCVHWVADGRVDCAAIDSTVLEQELQQFPELAGCLRMVTTIVPYPIPQIAINPRLGESLIQRLQSALLQPTAALRSRLHQQGVSHYAAVTNHNTPDSFLNDVIRLAEITVQGLSHFFNVSFTPDSEKRSCPRLDRGLNLKACSNSVRTIVTGCDY